jgi:hypothetical protein
MAAAPEKPAGVQWVRDGDETPFSSVVDARRPVFRQTVDLDQTAASAAVVAGTISFREIPHESGP